MRDFLRHDAYSDVVQHPQEETLMAAASVLFHGLSQKPVKRKGTRETTACRGRELLTLYMGYRPLIQETARVN